jgi:transposase
LDARYPQKRFALVMDNLNVHKTAAVRATLRPYGGRVRVYFTPTSASWLNLIESWFSALSRAALRNSHPTGHEDVCALIGSYVQAWCADPHPYHWPRQQRPARRRHAYSAWSYRMRH